MGKECSREKEGGKEERRGCEVRRRKSTAESGKDRELK